jgi:DNA-binding transcriptional regulator YiaG
MVAPSSKVNDPRSASAQANQDAVEEMQAQPMDLPNVTNSPAPGSEQEEFKQPTFTRGIPGVGETSIVEPLVKVIDGPLTKSPARKGGRPVILVDGERIKELRGEYSQVVFARFCKVSVDAVQRAEHHGRSSDKTIRRIVRKLRGQGHKIEVKDLIKNPPQ